MPFDPASVEYDNPVHGNPELGTIECIVNDPVFGWIPYTASPTDTEGGGDILHARITTDGGIAPYVPPEAAVAPIPVTVSRRQFYEELAVELQITEAEALAVMQNNTLPADFQTYVDGLSAANAFKAKMYFLGEPYPARSSTWIEGVRIPLGMSANLMNELFKSAAVL